MARQLQPAAPLSEGSTLRSTSLTVTAGPRSAILQLDHPPSLDRLPAPGRCRRAGAMELLSIGPDRYLVLAPDPHALFPAAVDVSSAWTRLVVEGPDAAALLGKGCMLDLHPRHFAAGACAVTGFARMRIVLWRTDEQPRYDMLIGRSQALSLWDWLSDSAAAFRVGTNERAGVE